MRDNFSQLFFVLLARILSIQIDTREIKWNKVVKRSLVNKIQQVLSIVDEGTNILVNCKFSPRFWEVLKSERRLVDKPQFKKFSQA